jgi:xylulokinase
MHGSVFLDKNDNVIRRAILWNDQRTVAECQEIETSVGGRESLIQLVANPALTGFTAPKILWLRNNEPKHFDKLRKVLLPKDEIRRRLTGEYATEVSDASGMLLLDIANRNWSTQLLSALQLDIDLFGRVYESEDVTGQLTPNAAKQLGLTTDCLVVGGAGDCAAGAIGNGIVNEGILSTSIGTSGVMFVYSDEMKIDPLGRVHTFCHAVRGKWHLMGVNLSSGGSLQWFRNALCPELVAEAKKKKVEVYDLLTAEAEKTSPGSEGLYFLPYLSGERTPHADPFARGCFVGLTLVHGRGHLVRSIMEGVTYSMRDSLEIFQGLDIPVKQIRVSGGGSKSPFWRQIQADVFGQRVVTINSEEGPAFGVALLAAVGAGAFKNIQEACKAVIKVVKETKPNSKTKKIYDNAMPVYQNLYCSLKNDFRKL